MSLMSKLLMSSIVGSLVVSAGNFDVSKFVRKNIIKNPQVKVNSVKTIGVKEVAKDSKWKAYMILSNMTFHKRNVKEPMTIFVDEKDGLATMALLDMKSGKDYSRSIKPDMPNTYYNDAHLVMGNKDAKHKMVLFSDPQCPFCVAYVPKMLKDFKDKKPDVALYYYHMPLLRLHPVSGVLTRVMEVLQNEGKMDQALKIYGLKINPRETNETKILSALKKQLNISVSKEDINKKEIKSAVKKDVDAAMMMMIRGTPTVYFDGKYDGDRSQYKKYLK